MRFNFHTNVRRNRDPRNKNINQMYVHEENWIYNHIQVQNSCAAVFCVVVAIIKPCVSLSVCRGEWMSVFECDCEWVCVCRTFFRLFARSFAHIFLLQVNNVSFVTSSHVIRSHCERLSRLHPLVACDDETLLVYVWVSLCECVCSFLLLHNFFYDSSWTHYTERNQTHKVQQ